MLNIVIIFCKTESNGIHYKKQESPKPIWDQNDDSVQSDSKDKICLEFMDMHTTKHGIVIIYKSKNHYFLSIFCI